MRSYRRSLSRRRDRKRGGARWSRDAEVGGQCDAVDPQLRGQRTNDRDVRRACSQISPSRLLSSLSGCSVYRRYDNRSTRSSCACSSVFRQHSAHAPAITTSSSPFSNSPSACIRMEMIRDRRRASVKHCGLEPTAETCSSSARSEESGTHALIERLTALSPPLAAVARLAETRRSLTASVSMAKLMSMTLRLPRRYRASDRCYTTGPLPSPNQARLGQCAEVGSGRNQRKPALTRFHDIPLSGRTKAKRREPRRLSGGRGSSAAGGLSIRASASSMSARTRQCYGATALRDGAPGSTRSRRVRSRRGDRLSNVGRASSSSTTIQSFSSSVARPDSGASAPNGVVPAGRGVVSERSLAELSSSVASAIVIGWTVLRAQRTPRSGVELGVFGWE